MSYSTKGLVFTTVLLITLISSGVVFSQEGPSLAQSAEPEMQWVWGEMVSLDAANNQITVKYLDYENSAEKEIILGVNEKTTYENINSLGELKPKDTVSIDYIVSDGKNIAKNISMEKPEAAPAAPEAAVPQGEGTIASPAAEDAPVPLIEKETDTESAKDKEESQGISGY